MNPRRKTGNDALRMIQLDGVVLDNQGRTLSHGAEIAVREVDEDDIASPKWHHRRPYQDRPNPRQKTADARGRPRLLRESIPVDQCAVALSLERVAALPRQGRTRRLPIVRFEELHASMFPTLRLGFVRMIAGTASEEPQMSTAADSGEAPDASSSARGQPGSL